MRRIVPFALAAASLFGNALSAQFADFAVTDDGRLFFTTPLSTGGEDMRGKVYRVTSDGISLVATGSDRFDPAGPDAVLPLTSGDGSISGYATRYRDCNPRCSAFVLPRTSFTLNGAEGFSGFGYDFLEVARNARFLVGQTYDAKTRLIEVPSLQTREFPQYLRVAGRQAVANNGAVLLLASQPTFDLQFVPFGEQPRAIPGTQGAISAFLSPNADRVVYTKEARLFTELILTDSQGSTRRAIATGAHHSAFQPSFANDGTLLFLDVSGQPMLLAPGAEPRLLIAIEGGVKSAILSGNAQIAWLTTSNGRLLRVRTADASFDEFIPATPQIGPVQLSAFPGSVIRVFGSGLSEHTQFTLAGTPLRYSELTAQSAALQIPWEFPVAQGEQPLLIETAGHPFHLFARFNAIPQPAVNFERGNTAMDTVLQAAHQDFRGVISASDPAHPGETIHVFARNLGPVDQPIATGQRSPTSPPARIVTPLTCTLYEVGGGNPTPRADTLSIPFAGLSGGSIGIYQIDITIPADWTSPEASLRCTIDFRADIDRIAIAAPAAGLP